MMLHTKYQSSRHFGFRQEDLCYILNSKALGLVVSEKKIFLNFQLENIFFGLCDLDMQLTKTI